MPPDAAPERDIVREAHEWSHRLGQMKASGISICCTPPVTTMPNDLFDALRDWVMSLWVRRAAALPPAGGEPDLAAWGPRDEMMRVIGELVTRFGYGSKAGRPDYSAVIPLDQFDALTRTYKAYAAALAARPEGGSDGE